jgi:hypothetical protein
MSLDENSKSMTMWKMRHSAGTSVDNGQDMHNFRQRKEILLNNIQLLQQIQNDLQPHNWNNRNQ